MMLYRFEERVGISRFFAFFSFSFSAEVCLYGS